MNHVTGPEKCNLNQVLEKMHIIGIGFAVLSSCYAFLLFQLMMFVLFKLKTIYTKQILYYTRIHLKTSFHRTLNVIQLSVTLIYFSKK